MFFSLSTVVPPEDLSSEQGRDALHAAASPFSAVVEVRTEDRKPVDCGEPSLPNTFSDAFFATTNDSRLHLDAGSLEQHESCWFESSVEKALAHCETAKINAKTGTGILYRLVSKKPILFPNSAPHPSSATCYAWTPDRDFADRNPALYRSLEKLHRVLRLQDAVVVDGARVEGAGAIPPPIGGALPLVVLRPDFFRATAAHTNKLLEVCDEDVLFKEWLFRPPSELKLTQTILFHFAHIAAFTTDVLYPDRRKCVHEALLDLPSRRANGHQHTNKTQQHEQGDEGKGIINGRSNGTNGQHNIFTSNGPHDVTRNASSVKENCSSSDPACVRQPPTWPFELHFQFGVVSPHTFADKKRCFFEFLEKASPHMTEDLAVAKKRAEETFAAIALQDPVQIIDITKKQGVAMWVCLEVIPETISILSTSGWNFKEGTNICSVFGQGWEKRSENAKDGEQMITDEPQNADFPKMLIFWFRGCCANDVAPESKRMVRENDVAASGSVVSQKQVMDFYEAVNFHQGLLVAGLAQGIEATEHERALQMAIEHEQMHQETVVSTLWRGLVVPLPLVAEDMDRKRRRLSSSPESPKREAASVPFHNHMVKIAGRRVKIGTDSARFAWDNELPARYENGSVTFVHGSLITAT